MFSQEDFEDLWQRSAPRRLPQRNLRASVNRLVDEEGEGTHRAARDPFVNRVCRLVGEGAYSKACKHLVSAGIFESHPRVLEKLRALHPQEDEPDLSSLRLADAPTIPWYEDAESVEARLRSLETLIGSFRPGSAAGPSGLKPGHIRDCLVDADTASKGEFLSALDKFVRMCVHGHLPVPAVPFLCSAHLIPLKKSEGATVDDADLEIRPVAVGETLRRIVSKFLFKHPTVRSHARSLEPMQCGLGLPGACELIPLGTQALVSGLHAMAPEEEWGVLQVDFRTPLT